RALNAPPVAPSRPPPDLPGPFANLGALVDYMRARGNDLERPATSLLPIIADLKASLAATAGCLYAGLSGSGPTCFGVFRDEGTAPRAAANLTAAHAAYWIRSVRIGGDT